MADFKEMTDLLDAELMHLSESVNALSAGTDAHSKAIKDLAEVYKARVEAEKLRISEEDQMEKRKETKRLNSEELRIKQAQLDDTINRTEIDRKVKEEDIKIKQAQLENEIVRTETDRMSKKAMAKRDLADLGVKLLSNVGFAAVNMSMYGRAYAAERDGFMQPRQHLTRPADNITKLIR